MHTHKHPPFAVLSLSSACNIKQHGDGLLSTTLGAMDPWCSVTLYNGSSKFAMITIKCYITHVLAFKMKAFIKKE